MDHLCLVEGRLLADDPGLGKTFMAGEMDRLLRVSDQGVKAGEWKPTLVVVPKNLRYTWGEWYARYRPHTRTIVIDTRSPKHREVFANAVKSRSHDVYICHYEGLKLLLGILKDVEWLHFILDEAHRISNRKTQTSKAVRVVKAAWRTALTGTAASKSPDQLWAILNFLEPKVWTSYWAYRKRYVEERVDPIHGYRKAVGPNISMLPELQHRLKPMMVRRRKADVLPELPPKQYKNIWVDLSPKQRKIYDEMRTKMLTWVGEHEDEPLVATVAIAQLIRLQQIALATPAFVERTRMVAQYWVELDDFGNEAPDEEGNPIYLRDRQGRRISEGLPKLEEQVVEIHLEEPSSKLDAVMEVVTDLVQQGQQVVIFSQFTRMIDLLCTRLESAGIAYGKYTGQTRDTTRTRIEQEFAERKISVFAGQFQAGGVGLNLQTASTVCFLDRAWTARDNLQAEDRIHRMGQLAETITVIDFLGRDTVDRGRFQQMLDGWHGVQLLLGDKNFDWTHMESLEEPEEEEILA